MFYDFFIFEKYVDLPLKSNNQKTKNLRSPTKKAGSGSVSQWYESADPDPYQNVTDPQHWSKWNFDLLDCMNNNPN